MFSSLIQALGVDGTFFVQFVIFLLFYPILSHWLFLPYFKLQNQREEETVKRLKQVEELQRKKEHLKKEYEQKAYNINEKFNKIYNEESKQLRQSFLRRRIENQEENRREYERKSQTLLQEIKSAEDQMQSEINQLTEIAVDRLIS